MRFILYKDSVGEYRWTLYAANNTIIGASSEGYVNKSDCLDNIKAIKSCGNAPVDDRTD